MFAGLAAGAVVGVVVRGADGPPTSGPATSPAAVTGMRPTEPLSPAESAKKLHVKDGYAVDLVAAEPAVMSPVAFNWGPDGKLWVVEMAD